MSTFLRGAFLLVCLPVWAIQPESLSACHQALLQLSQGRFPVDHSLLEALQLAQKRFAASSLDRYRVFAKQLAVRENVTLPTIGSRVSVKHSTFRLTDVIGVGGEGVVYKARRVDGTEFSLKFFYNPLDAVSAVESLRTAQRQNVMTVPVVARQGHWLQMDYLEALPVSEIMDDSTFPTDFRKIIREKYQAINATNPLFTRKNIVYVFATGQVVLVDPI